MEAAADRLEKILPIALAAVAIVGVLLGAPGRAIDRHGAIDGTLALLVLATGLSIDGPSLGRAVSRWRRLLVVIALSSVGLPLLAFGIARLVEGHLRQAVLAAGVAPAEVASVGLVGLAGSDVAVAAAILAASAVLTVLGAGSVLGFLTGAIDAKSGNLLSTLVLVVALPLGVGAIAREALRLGPRSLAAGRILGSLALVVLLFEVASEVRVGPSIGTAAVVFALFLAGSVGLGWLLGAGLVVQARPSVLLPVAMRDFAVAAGIAASAFGPPAAGPLGIYGLEVLLFGALVARWRQRHQEGGARWET